MRVLFLRDNPISPDVRVEKEMKSLIKQGHEVFALGWDRDGTALEEETRSVEDKKIQIYRVYIPCRYGGGFKKNLIPLLAFQFQILSFLFKNRKRYDVIHACDFSTAFTSALFKMFYKKKLVYDIFDYYVDCFAVPLKLKNMVERLDHWVIKHADKTILCSEARIQQINLGCDWPFEIIHNAPDNQPINDSALLLRNKNAGIDKYKIAYVGSLSRERKLDIFAEVVQAMDNVEFHVAGFGEYEEYFNQADKNSTNIYFYGKINYEQALALENQCDGMIALYPPENRNHVFAAPNKFYEALLLGKPLLMIKGSGMADIVDAKQFGVGISLNKEEIENGVLELIELTGKTQIAEKMHKVFVEEYQWSIMEQRLKKIYEQIALC